MDEGEGQGAPGSGTGKLIKVDSLYDFLKTGFSDISFLLAKSAFVEEEHRKNIKLLAADFVTKQQKNAAGLTFEDIVQFLEFWMRTDQEVQVAKIALQPNTSETDSALPERQQGASKPSALSEERRPSQQHTRDPSQQQEADTSRQGQFSPSKQSIQFIEQEEEGGKQGSGDGGKGKAASNLEPSLVESIQRYEGLLSDCTDEVDRKIIQRTVDSLRLQLSQLNSERAGSNLGSVKFNSQQDLAHCRRIISSDKKILVLRDIYSFYCRQTYVEGTNATFDRIKHECNTMNLGKLCLACKDLGLLSGEPHLKRNQILEIFKKCSNFTKEVDFQQFQLIFRRFAETLYKDDPGQEDRFYNRICFENGQLKDKLKLLSIPFHMKDKWASGTEPAQKLQFGLQVGKMKQSGMAEEGSRSPEAESSRKKERSLTSQNMGNLSDLRSDRQLDALKHSNPVSMLLHKRKERVNRNKITWEKLESITFKDLNMMISQRGEQQFNPSLLFDAEDNDEDKYYLAEFSLDNKSGKVSLFSKDRVPGTSRKEKSLNNESKKRPTQNQGRAVRQEHQPTKKQKKKANIVMKLNEKLNNIIQKNFMQGNQPE